ncbi:transposase [Bacteroidota bacterium]
MKNKKIIGVDVSKNVLDIYILSLKMHFVVQNNPAGFANLLVTCCLKLSCKKNKLFFCFENTGRYSRLLSVFLQDSSIDFAMVNALDLKKSMGLNRGKSDKKDAKTIALYAWRKRDELKPTILHTKEVGQLRQLICLRDKFIKHRTA